MNLTTLTEKLLHLTQQDNNRVRARRDGEQPESEKIFHEIELSRVQCAADYIASHNVPERAKRKAFRAKMDLKKVEVKWHTESLKTLAKYIFRRL